MADVDSTYWTICNSAGNSFLRKLFGKEIKQVLEQCPNFGTFAEHMELPEFTEEIKTTEAAGAFRAHLRYLQALARIATDGQARMANAYIVLRDKVAFSPQRPRIKHAMYGVAQVRRSLENAWGTELLLYMGHQFLKAEEIIRLSNTWNVVQAYYAVYHVTQALLIAKGYVRPEKHATTQALFVELWGETS